MGSDCTIFFFRNLVSVHEMSIDKAIFQKVDAFEHFDALLARKGFDYVHATRSLQENVDNHPVSFMLGLFIR